MGQCVALFAKSDRPLRHFVKPIPQDSTSVRRRIPVSAIAAAPTSNVRRETDMQPTRRVQGGSGAAAYVSHAAISRASLDSRQCSILCSYANAALGLTECDWPPTLRRSLNEFLRVRIRC